jgi:deazaflavin-dependent oxidoreductase (nitroreductase family)
MASSRPGSWLGARYLHHLDLLFFARTSSDWSPTALLSGVPKLVLLTTTGAKTGQRRRVPLIPIPGQDRELAVIASNWGQSQHPAWYHNLLANPEADVTYNGRTSRYRARPASDDERHLYWQAATKLYVGYSRYEQRAANRVIPIMVLTPLEDDPTS